MLHEGFAEAWHQEDMLHGFALCSRMNGSSLFAKNVVDGGTGKNEMMLAGANRNACQHVFAVDKLVQRVYPSKIVSSEYYVSSRDPQPNGLVLTSLF